MYRAARLVKLQDRLRIEEEEEVIALSNSLSNNPSETNVRKGYENRRHSMSRIKELMIKVDKNSPMNQKPENDIKGIPKPIYAFPPPALSTTASFTHTSRFDQGFSDEPAIATVTSICDAPEPFELTKLPSALSLSNIRSDTATPTENSSGNRSKSVRFNESSVVGEIDAKSTRTTSIPLPPSNAIDSSASTTNPTKRLAGKSRGEGSVIRSKPSQMNILSDSHPLTSSSGKKDLFNAVELLLLKSSINPPKDPIVVTRYLSSLDDTERKRFLRKLIHEARIETIRMTEKLNNTHKEDLQDTFILQQFLIHSLSGLKQKIAKRYFFKDYQKYFSSTSGYILIDSNNIYKAATEMASIVFLPLYIIGMVLYIFLFGVQLGPSGTRIWLIQLAISTSQTIFLLQPIRIWIEFIVLSSFADEIRLWHSLLKSRAKVSPSVPCPLGGGL